MNFFSEQPVSIEMGNNEHKHNDNKILKNDEKNCINYKEKINTTTKVNEMKKVQVQQQKECPTKMKRRTPEQIVKQIMKLVKQAGAKLIFFVCSLKFTP